MRRSGLAWVWVLSAGIVLFVTTLVVVESGGGRFFPAFVVIGATVVPAAVVTFLGGFERRQDIGLHLTAPTGSIISAFFIGGIIGVVFAAVIEFTTLRTIGIPQLFAVGLIEESAKLVFPVILLLRGRFRTETDGLLFGAATGMGFAALETIGYGFTAYLQTHGNIGVVEQTLVFRGLFSPAGHATWTALVCLMLWHQRNRAGHPVFNLAVLGALVLAILLHASWDIVSGINALPLPVLILCYLGIAAIGIGVLAFWMYRWRSRPPQPGAGPNPDGP